MAAQVLQAILLALLFTMVRAAAAVWMAVKLDLICGLQPHKEVLGVEVMAAITRDPILQVGFHTIHGCLEQTAHLIPVVAVVAVDGVAVRLDLADLVL